MRFQVLGTPIEVRWAFWVVALLFGYLGQPEARSVGAVAASMAVVFAAVVTHELGHALVARAFGASPRILLHGFGGTTHYEAGRLSRGKRVLTTLAGPGAGFALGVAVLLVARAYPPTDRVTQDLVRQALMCTFGWGIVNMLPVLPFDGGLVLRDALGPSRGRAVLLLSAFFGAVLVVFFLKIGWVFAGILFATATYQSARGAWAYGEFEAELKARAEASQQRLEAARRRLEAGDLDGAEAKAGEAAALAVDAAGRDGARRVAAAAALGREDGARALDVLARLEQPGEIDDVLRAQALDLSGRRDEGFALLESSVRQNPAGPALEALFRGLLATGEIRKAIDLAEAQHSQGSVEALAWLASELPGVGEPERGVRLFEALFARTGDARFEAAAVKARGQG